MCKTWDPFILFQSIHSLVMLFCFFVLCSAIVENMAEFRPGLCSEAAQQGLMQWLLKRIKVKMAPGKQEVFKLKHSPEVCCRSVSFCTQKLDLPIFFLMHAAAFAPTDEMVTSTLNI